MKNTDKKKEYGAIEVEATVILPIAILCVILLLYLSLFLFQRANLQATLETVLVYYKNTVTDTYVTKNTGLSYAWEGDTRTAGGNSYNIDGPKNPYRGIFGEPYDLGNSGDFEAYFNSIAGDMLFDDDLTLTVDFTNFVILKQLEATATQKVKAPIDFSIIGVDNEYEISATARVMIADHDDMIRNVDFAIDILEDTALGGILQEFAGKITEVYDTMKEKLGVE